jgi:2-dehydro-3-deoxy-D-arabinonate dehydratase
VKLYRTKFGNVVEQKDKFFRIEGTSWDQLLRHDDLERHLSLVISSAPEASREAIADDCLLPPIQSQEVWAAGVTYLRSRTARMEESSVAGGGSFYDRVYVADRPELFFKATPNRVVGHKGDVAIRKDATWSVPEPELTLVISASGKVVGYTVGNDMSSRDIEGENPLYLPQAKVYSRSCALGPGILVSSQMLPRETKIQLDIVRANEKVFTGTTTLNNLKRDPATLVSYLFRENEYPNGCFLLTGTGIVPPDSFNLALGDTIHITIDGIGTLTNFVR